MSTSTHRRVPLLGGLGLTLVAALIVLAAALRDPASLAALEGNSVGSDSTAAGAATASALPAGEAALGDAQIEAAVTPEALQDLANRYPNDVRVWRKLVASYGNEEKTAEPALRALRHLLDLEPGSASDPVSEQLVEYGASLVATRDLAFETMRDHMGAAGADVLWEISTSTTLPASAREKAWATLKEDAVVVAKETPALKIAVELKKIDQPCQRKGLLATAEKDGDKRSLPYLKTPPIMACGFMGLSTCDCFTPKDHAALKSATDAIDARDKEAH